MNAEILKMLAPFAIAVGALVALVLWLAGLPLAVAIIGGLLVAALAVALIPRRADRLVLRGLPVAPLEVEDSPRLHNVIDGLCNTYGFKRPDLVLINTPAINAVAFGRKADEATIGVTRGLVESLDRIQLEGVLARELAAVNAPNRPAATAAVAARSYAPGPLRRSGLAHIHGDATAVRFDFDGARLTRYPPGLLSALTAISTRSSQVADANPAARHLWLVDPVDGGAHEWTIDLRIDALKEL